MNHGEARIAAGKLGSLGYSVLDPIDGKADPASDAVLLFTCDVIERTERNMWKRIEEITSEGKELFVAGCLAALGSPQIKERFPGVKILDSMGLDQLDRSLKEHFDVDNESTIGSRDSNCRVDQIVPISNGCLGSCTYCLTKHARGVLVSYPESMIIDNIRNALEAKRKEILLTSQDTGIYGLDRGDTNLGQLLKSITQKIEGDIRIRVGMMNPAHIMDRLESVIEGFRDPRIFRFFHIPVQSGSDTVLERMGRGYDAEGFVRMVERIRDEYPRTTISTDVIVGFPGETSEDHDKTVDLLRTIAPEVLNITRFSPRKGTPACDLDGKIRGGEMKMRSRELSRLHTEITEQRLRDRLGLHRSCLITEVGKSGTMMARDENYTPIVIDGDPSMLGQFVDIVSFETAASYLIGRIQEQ